MATDGCTLKAVKPAVGASAGVPMGRDNRHQPSLWGSTAAPLALPFADFVCHPRRGQPPIRHHPRRTDFRIKRRIKLLSSTYLSQGAARPHTAYQWVAQHRHWTFTSAPHRGDPEVTDSSTSCLMFRILIASGLPF